MSEIKVMASGALKEAYSALVPAFERASGHRVNTVWAPSVAMKKRLHGGESVDLVILSADALDEMIRDGLVAVRFDLATSGIGVAVKAGAPKPDIRSGEAVKRAVLAANGIAYSTGPSGIYLAELFQRWGIAEQIAPKVTRTQGVPSGSVVARGDAEIAFQQVSELLPVPGIDLVGPLPPDIQHITTFCAGLHVKAQAPDAARALVDYLRSPQSAPAIREAGLEPA